MNQSDVSEELVQLIPFLMRKMHSYMRCHNENMMSAHFRLLTMLGKRARTMSELAEMQSVSPATLSNSVAILVEKGWVRRIPAPEDRRIIRVELTDLGRQKLIEIDEHLHSSLEKMVGELSHEELDQVGKGLSILRRLLVSEFQRQVPCEHELAEHAGHPHAGFERIE